MPAAHPGRGSPARSYVVDHGHAVGLPPRVVEDGGDVGDAEATGQSRVERGVDEDAEGGSPSEAEDTVEEPGCACGGGDSVVRERCEV